MLAASWMLGRWLLLVSLMQGLVELIRLLLELARSSEILEKAAHSFEDDL